MISVLIVSATLSAQGVLGIFPDARQEAASKRIERSVKRDYYRSKNAVKGKPSAAYPIPDSDGYRVSNALGTVYCGIHGCWRR